MFNVFGDLTAVEKVYEFISSMLGKIAPIEMLLKANNIPKLPKIIEFVLEKNILTSSGVLKYYA